MDVQGDGLSRPKSLALGKMELLVRQMQSQETGVPVRCQKLFLTTIPSAFMGYDLVEWLMENLPIEDSAEALHLASLLCQHGYFFPVGDAKTLMVKDDSSLYRFQTPYYWPSQNHVPDSTDYAIYLNKRIAKNRQKHGLEEYELETFNQLKKTLSSKWDFVSLQSDEQVKMAKDRKKGDKIVSDSQERAYWRVYRPPPGFTNALELPIVPQPSKAPSSKPPSMDYLKKQVKFLQQSVMRSRIKKTQVADSLLANYETYLEFDPFMAPVFPSNPWLTDDPTFMEVNEPLVECPTEQRVRRWAIGINETISDPTGLVEFTNYMRKEFSHENIRFWTAVYQLKKASLKEVDAMVKSIYNEFLRPGAPCEINIDGRTMEVTQERMKKPSRLTFDCAAEHILILLLKKDCYPRFLRSDHYKNLLMNATNPTSKKRFFAFGAPGKKKISTVTPPNPIQLSAQATGSSRPINDDQGGDLPCMEKRHPPEPTLKEEDAGIFLGDNSDVCAQSSAPVTTKPTAPGSKPGAPLSESPAKPAPAGTPGLAKAAPQEPQRKTAAVSTATSCELPPLTPAVAVSPREVPSKSEEAASSPCTSSSAVPSVVTAAVTVTAANASVRSKLSVADSAAPETLSCETTFSSAATTAALSSSVVTTSSSSASLSQINMSVPDVIVTVPATSVVCISQCSIVSTNPCSVSSSAVVSTSVLSSTTSCTEASSSCRPSALKSSLAAKVGLESPSPSVSGSIDVCVAPAPAPCVVDDVIAPVSVNAVVCLPVCEISKEPVSSIASESVDSGTTPVGLSEDASEASDKSQAVEKTVETVEATPETLEATETPESIATPENIVTPENIGTPETTADIETSKKTTKQDSEESATIADSDKTPSIKSSKQCVLEATHSVSSVDSNSNSSSDVQSHDEKCTSTQHSSGALAIPPPMFQDAATAPLASIEEHSEGYSDSVSLPSRAKVCKSSVRSRTEIVTLTDSSAQTVETGDNPIYNTTDQECEADMETVDERHRHGARRKEKRVKSGKSQDAKGEKKSHGGEKSEKDREKKRERKTASTGDSKKDKKDSKGNKEARKKSSERQKAARNAMNQMLDPNRRDSRDDSIDLDADENVSLNRAAAPKEGESIKDKIPATVSELSECPDDSPRKLLMLDAKPMVLTSDLATTTELKLEEGAGASDLPSVASEPHTQEAPTEKPAETSVCPWENEESSKVDTSFVKTYSTLGYL